LPRPGHSRKAALGPERRSRDPATPGFIVRGRGKGRGGWVQGKHPRRRGIELWSWSGPHHGARLGRATRGRGEFMALPLAPVDRVAPDPVLAPKPRLEARPAPIPRWIPAAVFAL